MESEHRDSVMTALTPGAVAHSHSMTAVPRPPGSIAVILNPAAQSMRASRRLQSVRTLTAVARLAETQAAGDARRMARELAEGGWTTIVAAGGDGTMNEVVSGLMEAKVEVLPELGLLPMGTMNVFALELGLPVLDLAACWQRVTDGRTREVDAWRAGSHVFVQMAGVGIDAQVIRQTTWQAKKQWGPLSYLGTLSRLLDSPPAELRLRVDGGPWLTGTSALMGNGRLYGGPFPVFPDAGNDDGCLDVALIHGHGPSTFSNLVADVLLRGIDENHGGVTRQRGWQITIEAADPQPFEIDGEIGGETPLVVTPHEKRLRVVV